MSRTKVCVAAVLAALILTGCVADLTVTSVEQNWAVDRTAKAKIANIGTKDAGPFMVYFNADENPESSNYRPQVSHHVAGLAKGAAVALEADFAPLARPENHNLANVFRITVIADPKGMVKELNENNNTAQVAVP